MDYPHIHDMEWRDNRSCLRRPYLLWHLTYPQVCWYHHPLQDFQHHFPHGLPRDTFFHPLLWSVYPKWFFKRRQMWHLLAMSPGMFCFSHQFFKKTFYYEIFRCISAMTTTFHCPHVHHLRCPTRTSPIVNFTSMGQLQRDGYQDDDASTCGLFTMCAIANCVRGFYSSGFALRTIVFNNLKTLLIIYFPPVHSSCRTTS